MWDSLQVERTVLRTTTYILLIIVAAVTAYFNLIYGVTFTASQNYAWLTSVFVGIITGARPSVS